MTVVALAFAGCGGAKVRPSDPGSPVVVPTASDGLTGATAAQVLGPWSLTSFQLAAPLISAIDSACRGKLTPFPDGVQLVLVDARGAGVKRAIPIPMRGA